MERFKNQILNLVLLSFISLFIVTCKKNVNDIPDDQNVNGLHVNWRYYPLSQGYILKGNNPYAINFGVKAISLLSPEYTIYEKGQKVDSISGFGSAVILCINTDSSPVLNAGIYKIDTDSFNGLGEYWVNLGFNEITSDNSIEIKKGTLYVLQNGTPHEISFDGTDEKGRNIRVYFKGNLKYYDIDSTKGFKINKFQYLNKQLVN